MAGLGFAVITNVAWLGFLGFEFFKLIEFAFSNPFTMTVSPVTGVTPDCRAGRAPAHSRNSRAALVLVTNEGVVHLINGPGRREAAFTHGRLFSSHRQALVARDG